MPVVNVEIPKNETAPKSERVYIATNANPAIIAGLAEGRMILKKVFQKGFESIELDMSEFEKADGGVTCLSIIFPS